MVGYILSMRRAFFRTFSIAGMEILNASACLDAINNENAEPALMYLFGNMLKC